MKKILLFMLPIMALCLASCEKNNENNELSGDDIIQFEDAHFLHALLCVQEIWIYDAERDDWIGYMVDVDRNRDGQISVNEAQQVRGLDLYDYEAGESFNVLSMPEIKYFTALEYLDCSDNQLTSLDVSKNTALTDLDCSGNQLTSLDVSKNTALTDLLCHENQLTSLDVSNNTALTGFACSGNQLTSLDVSSNTALIYLSCDDNQLTSLDVHHNRELAEVYCGNNPLQKLILYTYHNIYNMFEIESEYGDIIEYME